MRRQFADKQSNTAHPHDLPKRVDSYQMCVIIWRVHHHQPPDCTCDTSSSHSVSHTYGVGCALCMNVCACVWGCMEPAPNQIQTSASVLTSHHNAHKNSNKYSIHTSTSTYTRICVHRHDKCFNRCMPAMLNAIVYACHAGCNSVCLSCWLQ
jgi:hypothetical protein